MNSIEKDIRRLATMLALAEASANPSDGERLAALAAVERTLAQYGMTLRDLAQPIEAPAQQMPLMVTWRQTCRDCLKHQSFLSAWEIGFLTKLLGFRRPSVKQKYCLNEIADRLGVQHGRDVA